MQQVGIFTHCLYQSWSTTSSATYRMLRIIQQWDFLGMLYVELLARAAAGGWPQPPGTTAKIVLDTDDKTKASFF